MFPSPTQQMDTSYNSPNEFNRQNDEADTQKGPILFGTKRRSIAVTRTPSFMGSNPIVGISSPSTDIFASPAPAQSALPHHMRESTPSGIGKSVHWSPSLVADRNLSSPLVKPTQGISSSSNAPPLRSLRDETEPVRKTSRRSLSTTISHNQSINSSIIMSTGDLPENQEPTSSTDNWVTVFGFSPDQAYTVLQFMSRHGEVVQHQSPPKGNWMHIGYSCSTHARQALSRNGALIDGILRIGVIPTPEKELNISVTSPIPAMTLNRSSIIEHSIREEPEEEIPLGNRDQNVSILDNSLNTSRASMVSRTTMRPLNSSFRPLADTQRKQQEQTSFMTKLWNTVGF